MCMGKVVWRLFWSRCVPHSSTGASASTGRVFPSRQREALARAARSFTQSMILPMRLLGNVARAELVSEGPFFPSSVYVQKILTHESLNLSASSSATSLIKDINKDKVKRLVEAYVEKYKR